MDRGRLQATPKVKVGRVPVVVEAGGVHLRSRRSMGMGRGEVGGGEAERVVVGGRAGEWTVGWIGEGRRR